MELLTITNKNGMTSNREPSLECPVVYPLKATLKRPNVFDKPTIFLTARVHPGEVPSTHVLNGIIKFIL